MARQIILLIVVFNVFGLFQKTDAILCYFCADSTDNEDIAHCIHKVNRLKYQRMSFEEDPINRPMKNYPYLKNCSHYIKTDSGEELFQFCKIENIESFGTVNAFIRDCSDMRNFSPMNVTSFKYVKGDNQTICGYSQLQGQTICVSVCTGDFCNGPSTAANTIASAVTIAIMAVGAVTLTHW